MDKLVQMVYGVIKAMIIEKVMHLNTPQLSQILL